MSTYSKFKNRKFNKYATNRDLFKMNDNLDQKTCDIYLAGMIILISVVTIIYLIIY